MRRYRAKITVLPLFLENCLAYKKAAKQNNQSEILANGIILLTVSTKRQYALSSKRPCYWHPTRDCLNIIVLLALPSFLNNDHPTLGLLKMGK